MSSSSFVITAASQISALGCGIGALREALTKPQQPVAIGSFEYHAFDEPVFGYKVNGFDPEAVLGKKGLRTKDWATKLLLGAFEMGFKEQIAQRTAAGECPGFAVGTMFGSVASIGDFLSESIVNGVHAVNPQAFANTVINAPTGNANIRYENRTLSATIANGFGSSFGALVYATDYLRHGYAESIIAGGFDEISYYTLLGLQINKLSSNNPITPFAQTPRGLCIGEGCALFLIESAMRAETFGVPVLARIAGIASFFDPPQTGASELPGGEGLDRAIQDACDQAGITPAQISWVASDANGTVLDGVEAQVLQSIVPHAPVTSYKSRLGECMGGAQALTVACAIVDINAQRISGIQADYPHSAQTNLVTQTRFCNASYVLITMLTCEGHCGALILKRS